MSPTQCTCDFSFVRLLLALRIGKFFVFFSVRTLFKFFVFFPLSPQNRPIAFAFCLSVSHSHTLQQVEHVRRFSISCKHKVVPELIRTKKLISYGGRWRVESPGTIQTLFFLLWWIYSFHFSICYCIVPRCSVTFWTHPETIPVGQFFRWWIKSINQA